MKPLDKEVREFQKNDIHSMDSIGLKIFQKFAALGENWEKCPLEPFLKPSAVFYSYCMKGLKNFFPRVP